MKRFVIALLFILFAATVVRAEMLSIAGQRVNMRSGPGTRYAVLWELGSGFPLKVIEQKGKWVRVKDFEGDTGWVFKKLTNRTPTVIVTRKLINIRSGPGTKNRIVGKATHGTVLKIITNSKGWVKVRHSSNVVGWVKRNLVWGW